VSAELAQSKPVVGFISRSEHIKIHTIFSRQSLHSDGKRENYRLDRKPDINAISLCRVLYKEGYPATCVNKSANICAQQSTTVDDDAMVKKAVLIRIFPMDVASS